MKGIRTVKSQGKHFLEGEYCICGEEDIALMRQYNIKAYFYTFYDGRYPMYWLPM